jgi:hypothetical protein
MIRSSTRRMTTINYKDTNSFSLKEFIEIFFKKNLIRPLIIASHHMPLTELEDEK